VTDYPDIYQPREGITLYRGDCLDILPTLTGVDAVVTDPPYAINGGGSSIAGRATEAAFDTQFFRVWVRHILTSAKGVNPSAAWWFTIDWRGAIAVEQASIGTRFRLAGVGVWDRGGLGMGFALRKTYENFVVLVGDEWQRTLTDEPDVWRIPWYPANRENDHQAEKPVALMERAMKLTGGALVLDPFMGSGTTGIACIRTGRRFIGIEIDPAHYATACRRIDNELQQMTLPIVSPQ